MPLCNHERTVGGRLTPAVGANCALFGGEWTSLYDDRRITSARDLDIDHVIPPLAES